MADKKIVTLNNLGSRLDVGVIEPNKISVAPPNHPTTGVPLELKPFVDSNGFTRYAWSEVI